MLSKLHISPIKFTAILSLLFHASVLLKVGDDYERSYGQHDTSYTQLQVINLAKKKMLTTIRENKIIKKQPVKKNAENPKPENEYKDKKEANADKNITLPALETISLTEILKQKQVYLDKVLNSIEENKTYPGSARRRNIKGRVSISMHLDTYGKIIFLKCLKGHYLLCKSAIDAAQAAQPYSPLPKGMNSLAFEYEMNFRLK